MMKTLWYVVVMLLVPWHVLADVGGLLDKDSGIVTQPSPYSVSATMDRVDAAAKGVGATIFNRIDYQLDFCPFEPHPGVRGLGNRIFYGEIAVNLPGSEAVVSPIEGPRR
jgi:hypothetical protein